MIFDKGAKIIQLRKDSLQQMVLGKLDIHIQKNEHGPLHLTPYTKKTNSKWIKDPNIGTKTIKLLEENIG